MTFPLTTETLTYSGMRWRNAVPFSPDGVAAAVISGIGFAPITALALSLMGMLTLPVASLLLVFPALGVAVGLNHYQPRHGRLMLRGYVMGMVAVTCYDGVRIPFIMAGWMDDFIPKIGGMLMGDGNPNTVLGYLWRYLGNGGGMGMAFVCAFFLLRQEWVTPRVARRMGIGFGCLVWVCLIITLKVSPHGEEVMFVITPVSLLLSWIGHVVFGYTLGWLVSHFGQDTERIPSGQIPGGDDRNKPGVERSEHSGVEAAGYSPLDGSQRRRLNPDK